jgi:hypothetical protein
LYNHGGFRLLVFSALLAGVSCAYSPAPANGVQACDSVGVKRCPTGYHCELGPGTCYRDGTSPGGWSAGSSGGGSGMGGTGGAGGVAGNPGTAGTGGSGAGGSVGTGGTGGVGTGGTSGSAGTGGTGGGVGTGGTGVPVGLNLRAGGITTIQGATLPATGLRLLEQGFEGGQMSCDTTKTKCVFGGLVP